MAAKEKTTSYRWNDGVIQRIDLRVQSNGRAVAYLYADESEAARTARQEIRSAIRLKGWGTLSDHRDGKFLLRVTGLRDGTELLAMLREHGFANGQPTTTQTADNTPAPQGFMESLRSNSLRSSGILYTIGNAMYVASGLARGKDKGQIGTGLAFGTGDALLAVVGGKDDARQFTSLVKQLKRHYERTGIEIPKNASIFPETSDADKSFGERVYDVLHQFVNPIKCFAEVVGAFFYFKAGHDQGNRWKQATAITFGTGFGASMLIPEKKLDEEKYAQADPLGKLWMKIQSNPLSVGGISGLSNTLFTTIGAVHERRAELAKPLGARTTHYRWDFAIPGVMLFANILYASSKKTTGGDIQTNAMVSDVYSVAAQILNKQPEGMREAAIASTAQFLGERTEIKDTRQQIVTRLREEMEIQRQNPWFETRGLTAYQPTPQPPRVRVPGLETAPQTHVQRNGLAHEAPLAPAMAKSSP